MSRRGRQRAAVAALALSVAACTVSQRDALHASPTATPAGQPTSAPSAAPRDHPSTEAASPDGAGQFQVVGRFDQELGREISGVATGRAVVGLWLVDDEPGTDTVHLVARDGTLRASVTLLDVTTVNPEDLAVGPCPAEPARSCVHVADIGDNVAARDDVAVLTFPEAVAADGGRVTVTPTVRRLTYAAGPVDAEALVVAADGTVVIVDRRPDVAGVHVAAPGATELRRAGEVTLPAPATPLLELVAGRVVTAADLHPDGDRLLLRTYDEVLEVTSPSGGSIIPTRPGDWAIAQRPGPLTLQGEAIAWDDEGIVAVSEGSTSIHRGR